MDELVSEIGVRKEVQPAGGSRQSSTILELQMLRRCSGSIRLSINYVVFVSIICRQSYPR